MTSNVSSYEISAYIQILKPLKIFYREKRHEYRRKQRDVRSNQKSRIYKFCGLKRRKKRQREEDKREDKRVETGMTGEDNKANRKRGRKYTHNNTGGGETLKYQQNNQEIEVGQEETIGK